MVIQGQQDWSVVVGADTVVVSNSLLGREGVCGCDIDCEGERVCVGVV